MGLSAPSTLIHLHPCGNRKHSTDAGWAPPLIVETTHQSSGFRCTPFPCTWSRDPALLKIGGQFIICSAHLWRFRFQSVIFNISWDTYIVRSSKPQISRAAPSYFNLPRSNYSGWRPFGLLALQRRG